MCRVPQRGGGARSCKVNRFSVTAVRSRHPCLYPCGMRAAGGNVRCMAAGGVSRLFYHAMPRAAGSYAVGGIIVCRRWNHCMPVLRQWAAQFARNGFFCCRHRMPWGFVKVRSSRPALPPCGGRCVCVCRFAYLIGDFNQKFYYRAARARRLQMMAISLIFARAAYRLVCLPCV